MADKTKIAWCDSTFNPWIGCTKVGPGCDHCYAEADFDHRRHRVTWGAGQARSRTSAANWKNPVRWNRADFRECGDCGWRGEIDTLVDDTCPSCGRHEHLKPARRRVFCASLADVFDNSVHHSWRRDLFDLIGATPHLDWLLLTKRIGNAERLHNAAYGCDSGVPWPNNVWLGATVVNQDEADRDIPRLLAVPAAVRFLSMEPLLGPIDLTRLGSGIIRHNALRRLQGNYNGMGTGGSPIDWVIVGGESGPHARPMHPDWVRGLRDQCAAAGVPFLFKQWGEWGEVDDYDDDVLAAEEADDIGFMAGKDRAITLDGELFTHPMDLPIGVAGRWIRQWGKSSAGRLLDGQTWDQYPEARHA